MPAAVVAAFILREARSQVPEVPAVVELVHAKEQATPAQ
jgi:hypothetical protein